jgi:hypothetical protein
VLHRPIETTGVIGMWDSQQAWVKLRKYWLPLEESSLEENEKPLVRGSVIILLLVLGPVVLYIPNHDLLIHMPGGGLADLRKAYPIISLVCAVALLLRWLMKALA